jgi:hypothetical protein
LTFLVGQGQQDLPAGMAPLPSSLTAQAQAAIAKVGTSAGTCTGTAGAGSNATSTGGAPGGTGSSSTASNYGGSISPDAFANSRLLSLSEAKAAAGKNAANGGTAGDVARAAALSLGAFGKIAPDSWTVPFLGILVLTLLVPGLVFWTSRRSRGALGDLEQASEPSDPQAQSSADGGVET